MKRPDIEAIKERCEKATPGPWILDGESFDSHRNIKRQVENSSSGFRYVAGLALSPDAEFIAHARMDIPVLLIILRFIILVMRILQ